MNDTDAEFRERLVKPALIWVALMLLLVVISLVGVLTPTGNWWILEAASMVVMVAIVIVFSMEMFKHKPIVRLFSVLGFFWVSILFGLTMLDYLTR